MKDNMIRGLSYNGEISFVVATGGELVEELRKIHSLSPTATAALGRLSLACVMEGYTLKNDGDRINMIINGGGAIGSIVTEADNRGRVKGYVSNPFADAEITDKGKLNVSGIVGKDGFIRVIRDTGAPYVGETPLVSGEIGEDLSYYFLQSEQIPAAVGVGVLVGKDGVINAGGFIIKALPNATDATLDDLQSRVSRIASVTSILSEKNAPLAILDRIFDKYEILDSINLEHYCSCDKDRIDKVLISLGDKELQKILKEDGEIELACNFCKQKYHYNKQELEKIICDIKGEKA